MANKQGLFSSLFGGSKKVNQEAQEAAELEARERLEKRIEQVLAEAAQTPKSPVETEAAKPETVAEILPITASALTRRKTTPSVGFWQPTDETDRAYAVNER